MIETIAYFVAVGLGFFLGTILGFNFQMSRRFSAELAREQQQLESFYNAPHGSHKRRIHTKGQRT